MRQNRWNKRCLGLALVLLTLWLCPARRSEAAEPLLTAENFDADAYAARYADLAAFGGDAQLLFLHFMVCGAGEGREGHSTDAAVEAALNTSGAGARLQLLVRSAAAQGEGVRAALIRSNTELIAAAYFQNSLFIGDSITVGFAAYCRENAGVMNPELRFIAQSGYAVQNELGQSGARPVYPYGTEDVFAAVALLKPSRIFIALGINDIPYGVGRTYERYVTFLTRLHEAYPGAELHIISVSPVLTEDRDRSNASVALLDAQLRAYAAASGCGYIDLAARLSDADGGLDRRYCSDGWMHQNDAAYAVWAETLKRYACVRSGVAVED